MKRTFLNTQDRDAWCSLAFPQYDTAACVILLGRKFMSLFKKSFVLGIVGMVAGVAAQASDEFLDRLLRHEAFSGRTGKIRVLISRGANVNAQADYGETALGNATLFGKTKAAELLLDLGADPNLANDQGDTPFHTAASDCNADLLEKMLKSKVRLNERNRFGRTALINAVESNCVRSVALLLKQPGIDDQLLDHSSRRASDYTNHPWIVEMLEQVKLKRETPFIKPDLKILP
jgi:ankyrin repeat protein